VPGLADVVFSVDLDLSDFRRHREEISRTLDQLGRAGATGAGGGLPQATQQTQNYTRAQRDAIRAQIDNIKVLKQQEDLRKKQISTERELARRQQEAARINITAQQQKVKQQEALRRSIIDNLRVQKQKEDLARKQIQTERERIKLQNQLEKATKGGTDANNRYNKSISQIVGSAIKWAAVYTGDNKSYEKRRSGYDRIRLPADATRQNHGQDKGRNRRAWGTTYQVGHQICHYNGRCGRHRYRMGETG